MHPNQCPFFMKTLEWCRCTVWQAAQLWVTRVNMCSARPGCILRHMFVFSLWLQWSDGRMEVHYHSFRYVFVLPCDYICADHDLYLVFSVCVPCIMFACGVLLALMSYIMRRATCAVKIRACGRLAVRRKTHWMVATPHYCPI